MFNDFATDPSRNAMWKAFLKKIRWKQQIDFQDVMKCIKEKLERFWTPEL